MHQIVQQVRCLRLSVLERRYTVESQRQPDRSSRGRERGKRATRQPAAAEPSGSCEGETERERERIARKRRPVRTAQQPRSSRRFVYIRGKSWPGERVPSPRTTNVRRVEFRRASEAYRRARESRSRAAIDLRRRVLLLRVRVCVRVHTYFACAGAPPESTHSLHAPCMLD